jgi:hypothetical protein
MSCAHHTSAVAHDETLMQQQHIILHEQIRGMDRALPFPCVSARPLSLHCFTSRESVQQSIGQRKRSERALKCPPLCRCCRVCARPLLLLTFHMCYTRTGVPCPLCAAPVFPRRCAASARRSRVVRSKCPGPAVVHTAAAVRLTCLRAVVIGALMRQRRTIANGAANCRPACRLRLRCRCLRWCRCRRWGSTRRRLRRRSDQQCQQRCRRQ